MEAFSGLLVLAVIAGTYLLIRRERKRYTLRIRALEQITDMQIREARIQSAREIEGRLGQDLHDELSASLAGIVHQLEFLSGQTHDKYIKKHIDSLRAQTGDVYKSVRDKSHLLYSGASGHDLGESIKRITDLILPESLYHKELDIDQKAADTLNVDQRIEILRILQEAAGNIRKHAKNASDVFVFLYRDKTGEVVFQVGDNGRAFKKTPGGIGLKSIRKRVDALKGKFNIETGAGTVITITLPGEPEWESSLLVTP